MAASIKSLVPDDASTRIEDLEYLYASNANVSNFVSVKLSGNNNYHLWKTQMLCLMETHCMRSLVDDAFVDDPRPRTSSERTKKQYNSLLKGWIFGSISEGVLGTVVNLGSAKDVGVHGTVVNLGSAKDVWSILEHIYVPSMSSRQDSAQVKAEEKEETRDKDASIETKTKGHDVGSSSEKGDEVLKKFKLRMATKQALWKIAEDILKDGIDLEKKPLNGEHDTVLHIAVGLGYYDDFIKPLLQFIGKKEDSKKTSKTNNSALRMENLNGSTALHVAAIVGHKAAAELLVKTDNHLLTIKDKDGRLPLYKAYSNMQFDTFIYLWDQANNDESDTTMGVKLLVNAIHAKRYSTASMFVEKFLKFASQTEDVEKFIKCTSQTEDVMMAIARTFPNELDYWETLIYPCSLSEIGKRIVYKLRLVIVFLSLCGIDHVEMPLLYVPVIVASVVIWVYYLLSFLIYMVYLPFYFVYFLWWEVATRLGVPPVKDIVEKKKDWDEAKKLLELVCKTIDKSEFSGTRNPIYEKPILEAARQNAYQVVDEILYRSPDVILSRDENGADIIHLAIIHRSEKIYNLIYQIGEGKSRYKTWKDSSENNILHLVGRLAPSHELNSRTGAALQLQRELQWREELKNFVFPEDVTQDNIFKETPAMVFTREHKDLVKEGEKWMKATAESCSITAGLITTIVFAAAITVPGGNNQETGIPLFKNDIAFIIFAASDAISLFTSSTALLVFLSILTARFAEQDFLISLPRRLIIGFCALLLSTTAMMVSFSAILYLVFCDKKLWMIGLICGLAFIPIASFVALQFSLVVDLYQSTNVRIFGQQTNWRPSRFERRHERYFK